MAVIPPPILNSARLLSFASTVSETVEFTDRIELHVGCDGEFTRLGQVPFLAIAETFPPPGRILLMFCNECWETLGLSAFTSMEDAKLQAERGYRGISARWVNSPYTTDDEDRYLRNELNLDPRSEWWKTVCSFCGNDASSGGFVEGPRAVICECCVRTFHKQLGREGAA